MFLQNLSAGAPMNGASRTDRMTIYLKVPCRHCGKNIEFDSEYRGEWIECPHCEVMTVLENRSKPNPPAALPSPVELPIVRGRVITNTKTEHFGAGCFIQGLGVVGIVAVWWFPISTIIGFILLVAGGARARVTTCTCSVCGNIVGSKQARICPVCRALLE